MTFLMSVCLCGQGLHAADARPDAPRDAGRKTFVAVFDFACDGDEKFGRELANVIRMRLARHQELAVIDRFTTADFAQPLPASTDQAKVIALMKDRLAASLGVYGSVRRNGRDVRLELCCIDLRGGGEPRTWRKQFHDATERHNAVISKAAVEAITGQAEWVPPQYGDEQEPKSFGKPLNVNGSFDEGSHKGWQHPDNVASFLEKGPTGRGGILRIRTDLARWPYINYIRDIRMGKAHPSRPPKIATETGFSCLGGMEGVHFKSDWIKAAPGQRYWLMADFTRPGAKVFLKGFQKTEHALDGMPESALARLGMTAEQFAALPEARRKKLIAQAAEREPELFLRECYRWYLNCRGENGKWNHLAAPVPPRGGLPDYVEWLQIQVYCYWPAGTYQWDNVYLYKDPRQAAPLPEEKPRTPNVGKTSDVVERQTADEQRTKRDQRK
jgi:TolB-like protein